jgi:hypothetical protein
MLRERSEVITFARDDIERIVRYVAKERVVGSLFIGKFGDQTVRWLPDGGVEVITTYQEGDWHDLPPPNPAPAVIAEYTPAKKKKK